MTGVEPRTVMVVGASSGIGRSVALGAAAAGWRVAALGRNSTRLAEVRDAVEHSGGDGLAITCDATDPDSLAAAVAGVAERQGSIDVVVNCVGVNIPQRALTTLTLQGWHDLIQGNLEPAYLITQAVLPTFRQQHDGLLLHIASQSVKHPDLSGPGYQAGKAGVAALAHATMCEERDNGIRVTVVYPGMTNTPLVDQRPVPPTAAERARALQPDDVASMCLAVMHLPPRAYVPELVLSPVF